MKNMHDNDVNNIAVWNLLHNIWNTYNCVKNNNSYYLPSLHGYMNANRGKEKYKAF